MTERDRFGRMPVVFQSAPLTDVRGDWSNQNGLLAKQEFQSAPLTDVRGDFDYTIFLEGMRRMFQSAPLTDVRGDKPRGFSRSEGRTGFNPLPSRM